MKRVLVSVVLILFPGLLAAAEFTGRVVGVIDGDTIEVLRNQRSERIRLQGIDCPEKGQAYGKRAKQATSALVFGKDVTLDRSGEDRYGRTLADILLLDGTNVNQELVREGWCWWYRKYAPGNAELERLEREARETKKGLWKDPAPVPPWVYRKARSGTKRDHSDLMPLDTPQAGESLSRGPPSTEETASSAAHSPVPIIGNRKSRIYHRPDCPSYSQVSPRNRVPFQSAAEAEQGGYRIAKNCP
jgi:micrococcal nuclease